MKFDNLNSDDKEFYFNQVFAGGIYTIPEFSRRYGMPDLSEVDDVNAYVKKHYPEKYKKIVQDGYKMTEGDKLGATPKGYSAVKKSDIIAAVAKKVGTTKKAATAIVNAYWETIKATLKTNEKANITIPNVGSIRCVTQVGRTYNIKGLKKVKSKKPVKTKDTTKAKFFVSDNFLSKPATIKRKKSTTTTSRKRRGKKASTATTSTKSKGAKDAKTETKTSTPKPKTRGKNKRKSTKN